MKVPTYTYRARIERVIDGDTLDCAIDVGFRITVRIPVRLYGINAPERNTPEGKAARDFVILWAQQSPDDVVIETYKNPEKFGRWLGVVRHPLSERTLNHLLLEAGHAQPYPKDTP